MCYRGGTPRILRSEIDGGRLEGNIQQLLAACCYNSCSNLLQKIAKFTMLVYQCRYLARHGVVF